MNVGLQVHRKIKLLLKPNNLLEDLIVEYRDAFCFPGEAASKFRSALDGYLLLQQELSRHFQDSEPRLFTITEKCHFLQHLAMEAHFISPRLIWCFAGEDQQRRVQRLMASCVKGQRPGQSILKMVQRYRLALRLQFKSHIV